MRSASSPSSRYTSPELVPGICQSQAGEAQGLDRKIHLYDAFGSRESDTVAPGMELVTFGYGG